MLPRPFKDWNTYPGHGGIDYPYPRNTPVFASGPGVIDWSGYYSARGGYAKFITYDNGERQGYYHFDREQGLGRGSRVDYGTAFAYVGSLGQLSTGPHLHHEVWRNGTIIKPPAYWNYVDRNSYVGDGSSAGGGGNPFPNPEEDMGTIDNNTANKQVIKDAILEFFEQTGAPRAGRKWTFLENPHTIPKQNVKDSLYEFYIQADNPPAGHDTWPFFDFLIDAEQKVALSPIQIKAIIDGVVAGVVEGLPDDGTVDSDAIATKTVDLLWSRLAPGR